MERRIKSGRTIRLQDQINHPLLFRTPDAGCSRGAQSKERFAESMKADRSLSLNDQIAHLWATPNTMDYLPQRSPEALARQAATARKGRKRPSNLREQVCPETARMWATPTVNDAKNNGAPSQMERNSKALNAAAGGSLNPNWVEWLMGFPPGHTEIGG